MFPVEIFVVSPTGNLEPKLCWQLRVHEIEGQTLKDWIVLLSVTTGRNAHLRFEVPSFQRPLRLTSSGCACAYNALVEFLGPQVT